MTLCRFLLYKNTNVLSILMSSGWDLPNGKKQIWNSLLTARLSDDKYTADIRKEPSSNSAEVHKYKRDWRNSKKHSMCQQKPNVGIWTTRKETTPQQGMRCKYLSQHLLDPTVLLSARFILTFQVTATMTPKLNCWNILDTCIYWFRWETILLTLVG
jgi:hypothetical protein